jgi:hypothetical protein
MIFSNKNVNFREQFRRARFGADLDISLDADERPQSCDFSPGTGSGC